MEVGVTTTTLTSSQGQVFLVYFVSLLLEYEYEKESSVPVVPASISVAPYQFSHTVALISCIKLISDFNTSLQDQKTYLPCKELLCQTAPPETEPETEHISFRWKNDYQYQWHKRVCGLREIPFQMQTGAVLSHKQGQKYLKTKSYVGWLVVLGFLN